MKKYFITLFFIVLNLSFFPSAFLRAEDYSVKSEMNGINFKSYKGFDKKWKLVTVRYRKDTEEMRFTYANDLAYQTLKSGKTNYPDGAVFGKIGFKTSQDSLFPSSVVPQGVSRYQLMVKNKTKYKNENGWGYALFSEQFTTPPEDPKTAVAACYACHQAVSERGDVFSQLMDYQFKAAVTNTNAKRFLEFETILSSSLPEFIKKEIPGNFKYIRSLKGVMKTKLFQGTLDEIRPTLSAEASKVKLPAILINNDGTRYSIVVPENINSKCTDHGKEGISMKSIFTRPVGNNVTGTIRYCHIN